MSYTPDIRSCTHCQTVYQPEPKDFGLCCPCERDLIGVRVVGDHWAIQAKAAPKLVAIYQAARRLLTPDQCALLTAEEENAFGRIEAILANAGGTP